MKQILTITCSALLAVSLIGCGSGASETADKTDSPSADTKTVALVNTHCPIMMGKVDPKGETTSWDGKTVGYCCDECKGKFEGLSDDDKKKALAKAEKEGVDVDHDDLEHDHDKDDDHEHGKDDDHDHDKKDHDHDKKEDKKEG